MLLTQLPTWEKLAEHRLSWDGVRMRDLFQRNPNRFSHYSLRLDDLLLDYSKNLVTDETLMLLRKLAGEANLPAWTEAMFSGEQVNFTEKRAALHTALRADTKTPLMLDAQDVMPEVRRVLEQMRKFSHAVREGRWRGHTGKIITDIVNIGIGGSDLGPKMACRALRSYGNARLQMHFVSNIDPNHISDTLSALNAESTLFIVSSKSFTTIETLSNARIARRWLVERLGSELAVSRHFVAASTHREAVKAFGIDPENMFEFWDWVGGRYSLWSSIGLPIALFIGMSGFEAMLAGGREMDSHFRADPIQSMPGTLALLSVWYQHFWNAPSHAVLPYDIHLAKLPPYLQQLCMESNGKSTSRLGEKVDYPTGEIVWGEPGSNGQHAFFQLLHQGTRFIPTDFLLGATTSHPYDGLHQMLVANCFAQSEALMLGKTEAEASEELRAEGADEETIRLLLPHKIFPGNKPSNTLLYQTLDPRTLGRIVAMYEHKTLVQSVLWGINPFDQWGVEIGKRLAGVLMRELGEGQPISGHDASTNGLCAHYRALKGGNIST